MTDQHKPQADDKKTVDILVEGVPDYLYDQIKTAAQQTGQSISNWIMGACHMRYSSQFRDNLLYGIKKDKERKEGGGRPQII